MNPSPARKHLVYTELAKLLEAGFPIRKAIAVVLETRPPADQAEMLRMMDNCLIDGRSIATSFAAAGPGITELEVSIVGAGERGGRLAQAFRHLADYFGLLAEARGHVVRGFIYPLVLMHLGVFISVVPGGLMAEKSGAEIFLSGLLSLGGLYLTLAVVFFTARALLNAAPTHADIDRWLNRIPVLGGARRNLAMARFTKVYHTGVLAGLTMTETISLASRSAYSGLILEAGKSLLAQAEQGGPLGREFIRCRAFPPAFSRSYATAEEAGGLDKDLERWSKVFQDDAARGARAVAAALPKIFYGLMMLFILWKILGFYSGYYGEGGFLDSIGGEAE